ncbi:MAG: bifunctional lysylphosphatidylglycerol flippase/synthetase MprF [Deltaproteobacteria bacterium]|nr:bifunctional lysylphosphatidylglycerol flippase/synthetase MprF [Deltaproteobacteria bacterium]
MTHETWTRRLRALTPFAGLALFGLALWALHHELAGYTYHDVARSFIALAPSRIAAAVVLAALSYLMQTGYDAIGLRYAGQTLGYGRTALASFIGYAFSNTVGYSVLSGGSVRLRLYSGWGLSTPAVTRVVAFGALTFWVGFLAVSGAVFIAEPMAIPSALHLPFASLKPVGALFLAAVASYGALCLARKRPFVVRGIELEVPRPALLGAQIPVAALDWACASGALYVLLPDGAGISYPGLLGVYLLAQIAGAASQVPGGLGVFETIMVVLLAPALPASAVLGSLVAFRAVYYFLPLACAAVLLGGHELLARREGARRVAEALGRFAPTVVPMAFAAIAFLGGAILLFSGATPTVEWRLGWLMDVIPLPVMELSHFLGSVAGAGLLILGWGLQRRLDAAYVATMALLAVGIAVSLLKGLDYEEAVALTVMLLTLAPCRGYFYRKTALTSERPSASWIAAVALALTASTWLGLFSYKHVAYSHELWWSFAFLSDAPRFLRATAGTLIVVLLFAAARLLRVSPPRATGECASELTKVVPVVEGSKGTYAFLALLGDKKFLFGESGKSFIMYDVQGRSWVALGDPVGPPEERSELLWSFVELADRHNGWPVFYEVGREDLPLYLDLGLGLVKLGEEARVKVADFSLDGRSRKTLRHVRHKIEAEGCGFEIAPREAVPELLGELKVVSDAWLAAKRTREKGFSLGSFDASYLSRFPMALVRHEGRIVAFANLWRGADREEMSVDLMRFVPDAPAGLMDYMFVELIAHARKEGFRWFNLGMAPLSGLDDRALAPVWAKLGALMFRHGDQFYNFHGLREYKDKFDPVWEPRYLASPGGFVLPRILANVAALVSGGVKGVVAK